MLLARLHARACTRSGSSLSVSSTAFGVKGPCNSDLECDASAKALNAHQNYVDSGRSAEGHGTDVRWCYKTSQQDDDNNDGGKGATADEAMHQTHT